MTTKWLEGYNGQTIAQLIAFANEYRIDSLVCAMEEGIGRRPDATDLTKLTDTERIVLAVEGLEREVNNGGYAQFFDNSSKEFVPYIVDALQKIGCPNTAAITADAIGAFGLDEARREPPLQDCDDRYYDSGENIAEQLFAYVRAHQSDVRLP